MSIISCYTTLITLDKFLIGSEATQIAQFIKRAGHFIAIFSVKLPVNTVGCILICCPPNGYSENEYIVQTSMDTKFWNVSEQTRITQGNALPLDGRSYTRDLAKVLNRTI